MPRHLLENGANAYIDDDNLLGIVASAKIPELEWEMKSREALGMIGKMKLPVGIKELDGEITFNALDRKILLATGNPRRRRLLQIYSNIETITADGTDEEVQRIVAMRVSFYSRAVGEFKQQDPQDRTVKFTVYSLRETINGDLLYDLDIMTNKLTLGGDDIIRQYNMNIGAA